MFFFKNRYVYTLCITILSTLGSLCTQASENKCQSDNVTKALNCISKDNNSLRKRLEDNGNLKTKDFKNWKDDTFAKCEVRLNYSLGDGAALTREYCYNDEYRNRLKYLNQPIRNIKVSSKVKNDDGFYVTVLPYNSNDHINCIMSKEKNSCDKINLIDSSKLIKVYSFISASYGDSVVFDRTRSGVLLIASPSSDESGDLEINLTSVNSLGIIKNITLDASKNVLINRDYEILYTEKGKIKKLNLNDKGDFVK